MTVQIGDVYEARLWGEWARELTVVAIERGVAFLIDSLGDRYVFPLYDLENDSGSAREYGLRFVRWPLTRTKRGQLAHSATYGTMGLMYEFNEIVAKRIVASAARGCTRKAACLAARISQRTVQRWLARGKEEPDSLEGRFRLQLFEAEAGAEIVMSDALFEAGKKDWRAGLEWLKRRRRDEWGDQRPVKEPDDDLATMSDEQLRAECQRTLERLGRDIRRDVG